MTGRTPDRWRSRAVLVVAGVLLGSTAAAAPSQRPTRYVIAVGYNGVPGAPGEPGDAGMRRLQFADDDAANAYALFMEEADEGTLLADLDVETARRHPALAGKARPPTLDELRQAVKRVAKRIAEDQRVGRAPSVIFYYSGHGFASADGPGLALHAGAITTSVLYDEVIAPLSSAAVHILVDACHAEAVVRPRDLQAEIVDVLPAEAAAYVQHTTLARYPRVGAIVATTRGAQAHEWDAYGSGVFTHELLSGLRGAADVNDDGRVEYSEIEAFLAAANRDVIDPRARLDSVVHAPAGDARSPLIDLGRLAHAGRLRGHLSRLGDVYVEDERGVRLLDVHAEPGFMVTLVVPANRTLFVRSREAETEVLVGPGETFSLDGASFRSPELIPRGAVESALRRGLFGARFGPGYYLGYLDTHAPGVQLSLGEGGSNERLVKTTSPRQRASWICLGAAVALGSGALGVSSAALLSYRDAGSAASERAALTARDQYVERRNIALVLAATAAAAGVTGAILWRSRPADDLRLTASVAGPSVALAVSFK